MAFSLPRTLAPYKPTTPAWQFVASPSNGRCPSPPVRGVAIYGWSQQKMGRAPRLQKTPTDKGKTHRRRLERFNEITSDRLMDPPDVSTSIISVLSRGLLPTLETSRRL